MSSPPAHPRWDEPTRKLAQRLAPADTAVASPGEGALVERLRAGDRLAGEVLVRSHGGRLLATARRLLRREDEARDVVRETFSAAFRSLPRFDGECGLALWLHHLLMDRVLARLRRESSRRDSGIEDLLPRFDSSGRHATPIADWCVSSASCEVTYDIADRVRTAVSRLPLKHRALLLLRDIEGLGVEDVAGALSLCPSEVKSEIHRARQALRTTLAAVLSPTSQADH